ncbi:hypothetical protein ACWDAZ_05495 [Streptomyces sp. NPDC001215]
MDSGYPLFTGEMPWCEYEDLGLDGNPPWWCPDQATIVLPLTGHFHFYCDLHADSLRRVIRKLLNGRGVLGERDRVVRRCQIGTLHNNPFRQVACTDAAAWVVGSGDISGYVCTAHKQGFLSGVLIGWARPLYPIGEIGGQESSHDG